MNTVNEKLKTMQQLSAELLEQRPSVFRTGSVVLLLRLVSGLLCLFLYGAGIYLLVYDSENDLYAEVKIKEQLNAYYSLRMLGLVAIGLGLLINTIAWLCRVIRKRNWYILLSFEVLEWVSAFKIDEEDHSEIPNEQEIMCSTDKNIVLTSHRLIDRSDFMDRHLRLTDILSIEVRHQKQGYYKALAVFFSLLLVAVTVVFILLPPAFWDLTYVDIMGIMASVILPAFFSWLCLFGFTRRVLHVTGKYRNLNIDVHAFKKEQLKMFIQSLERERKKTR